jgi:hypothetical protein
MAHITLPEGLPGIVGPLTYSPETAKPLTDLAEVLLRGPNTLTSLTRMNATSVSFRIVLPLRRTWAATTI